MKLISGTVFNVLLIAFLAEGTEQILHESTHAISALFVGQRVLHFHFWAVDHGWPAGVAGSAWRDGIVEGSAAIVNILSAAACICIFPRLCRRPLLRLFVFFFGAYSLFAGFGYLLVDPLLASQEAVGDWAKVAMLLGGGWDVRIPIILAGGAGTVFGYFWMGKAALHFTWGDMRERRARIRTGLALCILPYVCVNAVFSVFTIWHPLGTIGQVATLLKYWLGFGGFFWAFMIRIVWMPYSGPFADESPLPRTFEPALAALALGYLLIAAVLLHGISFA